MGGRLMQEETFKQFSIWKVLRLCLLASLSITVIYIVLMQMELFNQLPNNIAFCISATLGATAFQLGYVIFYSKKHYQTLDFRGSLGLKNNLSAKEYCILILILTLITGLLFISVSPSGIYLQKSIFSWIPDWYVLNSSLTAYPINITITAIILTFLCTTLYVPIVEEIFFRGFLLPRMNRLGKWAIIINVLIFAAYHFWSPWQFVVRVVALYPLYYMVNKKQSLRLAIYVHCLINFISDTIIPVIALITL